MTTTKALNSSHVLPAAHTITACGGSIEDADTFDVELSAEHGCIDVNADCSCTCDTFLEAC